MNDIKPIETFYNGYRFRSRLEARWAVFFDASDISYEYEPEGFALNDGTRYLPDFYLPEFKCYVEIKPRSISRDKENEAYDKCVKLFEEIEDKYVILCIGDPLDNNITLISNDVGSSSAGASNGWQVHFEDDTWYYFQGDDGKIYQGTKGKHCPMMIVDQTNDKTFHTHNWTYATDRIICEGDVAFNGDDLSHQKDLARQARFEYGETPTFRKR